MTGFANSWLSGLAGGRQRRLEDDSFAQKQQVNALMGQAFTDESMRDANLAQVAAIDSQAAFAGAQGFGQMDDRVSKQRAGLAAIWRSTPAQGRNALMQQLGADFQRVGLDPNDPNFEQIATGLAAGQGGSELPSEIRTLLYLQENPGLLDVNNRLRGTFGFDNITNPDGSTSVLARNNRTGGVGPAGGQGQPAPMQGPSGSPTGSPQTDAIMVAANQMIKAGIPPEKVDEFVAQAMGSAPNVQMNPAEQAANRPLPSLNQVGGGIPGLGSGYGQTDAQRAGAAANQAAMVEDAKLRAQINLAPQQAQADADRARTVGQADNEVKKAAGRGKASLSLQQAQSRVARVDALVEGILPRIGPMTAGWVGGKLGEVDGTAASDLRKDLGTLQAIAGFDELNAMRAASPTGGALGNVTERELAFLQSVVRNIENSQSPAQLDRNIRAFQVELKGSWERVNQAFQDDYGQPQGQQANAGGADALSDDELRARLGL